MRNFFYSITSALARFMYGRNGRDQLNDALVTAYLVVWLVSIFLRQIPVVAAVIGILSILLAVLLLFRTFSQNLEKRREENAKFLAWWYPFKNRIANARQRRLDKDHKYFVCKDCKAVCRVPVGKGKIEITCPKCGRKMIGKS